MNILGVSALYHDSAAALIVDGSIIAAAQEERFTRKKHDAGIPVHAIRYCIESSNISRNDLDAVVFYDHPFLTLERWMKNILAKGSDANSVIGANYLDVFARRLWIHDLLKREIPTLGEQTKFLVAKHHISHAASAFYPSPFSDAVILTVDGVGEWTTLSIGVGRGNKIEIKEEMRYPHSLGLFYSAFTYFCGFKVNSGDYKFMGLAPYGEPIYYDLICKEIIDIREDGSFQLNLDYFDYQNGRTMTSKKMEVLFGGGRRVPETRITKREMDIAASVQKITEDILLKIVCYAKKTYGKTIDNLVMAGGVALNCVANGKILANQVFDHIWIQPAAGDAGGAVGAALYLYYDALNGLRARDENEDKQMGSYLGPEYGDEDIRRFLDANGYPYHEAQNLPEEIAKFLDEQKIIGLFEGRMEFGPRALGNRSIIADPRSEDMQARLNLKIKFRESFRPFAPSVLEERVEDYFELDVPSPYMLLCADVQESRRMPFDLKKYLSQNDMDMLPVVRTARSDIPAVTHVDYSARIQTVSRRTNPLYYDIIKAFENQTGCGVIVNTSFNVRGEPIVCSPVDAYRCFMRSDMDILAMGSFLLFKEEQTPIDDTDWRKEYELD